jgi:phosphoglycolate phosphatase-like HAD superfamily hydrolase
MKFRLIVFDFNGVVGGRSRGGPYRSYVRPRMSKLLRRLKQEGYELALWTSAMEETVKPVLDRVFGEKFFLFEWYRDRTLLERPDSFETIKPAMMLFRHPIINRDGIYTEENVLFVDDDPRKIKGTKNVLHWVSDESLLEALEAGPDPTLSRAGHDPTESV